VLKIKELELKLEQMLDEKARLHKEIDSN